MKITLPQRARPHRPNEHGFVAVLVMMTLLVLVLAWVASNAQVSESTLSKNSDFSTKDRFKE